MSKLDDARALAETAMADPSRENTVAAIRAALQARSGKPWSVKGGTGTAWGWITIQSPPRRQVNGAMTPEDLAELSRLLYGTDGQVHCQGETIAASYAYRRVAIQRALTGDANGFTAEPYWD